MNSDNLNLPPVKPNQPSIQVGNNPYPLGNPKSTKDFKKFLDPNVNEGGEVTLSEDQPSLFSLTATGKPKLKKSLQQPFLPAANLSNTVTDSETRPEMLADRLANPTNEFDRTSRETVSITNQNTLSSLNKTLKSKLSRNSPVPNQNIDEEDEQLAVTEFPPEIAAVGKEALAKVINSAFNSKNMEKTEEPVSILLSPERDEEKMTMRKQFEIPTGPFSPSDEDKMAQVQAQAGNLHLASLKELQNKSLTSSSESQDFHTFSETKSKNKLEPVKMDERLSSQQTGQPITPPPVVLESNSFSAQVATASHQAQLQEIIDKIVQSIHTLQKEGSTETVVTLKGPQFEGAKLTVKSFETAPNEFNIAFSDLSSPAKDLLDRKLTKDSLADNLDSQGYTIHIITTTTLTESTFNADQNRFAREQEQQQQQQQQQQAFEEETEET